MDFAHTAEDEAFRDEYRGWLDEHLPAFLEEWSSEEVDPAEAGSTGTMKSMERRRAWQRLLNEGRWAAINWPKEWGGRGVTAVEQFI
ncbi:MAG TPA: acyl-CoA dehydrogenase family protein, partial [Acidimicrobiales bacterium]|nr:acyl-CoA dehydrogenase family protein [Acidimicrobiales bacterium]